MPARLFLSSLVLLFAIGGYAGAEQVPEYQLKAEFLERFTRFVEWPKGGDNRPFTIGVVGRSPFNGYLERIAGSRRIKGRTAEIRYVTELSQIEGCALLFICESEKDRLKAILAKTESRPILTIGDSGGYGAAGVLFNFYTAGETIRFEINESAVEKSGLRVSSKLFKLARLVEPEVK